MIDLLSKIENSVTCLLEFTKTGKVGVTLTTSKEEVKLLEKSLEEEYDDVRLDYVGFEPNVASFSLHNINFTLIINS